MVIPLLQLARIPRFTLILSWVRATRTVACFDDTGSEEINYYTQHSWNIVSILTTPKPMGLVQR